MSGKLNTLGCHLTFYWHHRPDKLVNISLPMFIACNIMLLIAILQFYLTAHVSIALSLAPIQKSYSETAFKGN